ncbi:unnamed protein product [Moneuplotes crassus]|uniref:Uncharacterized protein n=1 Tax=Euplotes crassus TaxID=5936 RepID=A0AAD2D8A2_EUPCR|nr:unnamed protein product [Moneuplotes crassus]
MAEIGEDDLQSFEKRFPGLLDEVDSSIGDVMSDAGDQSSTFYALAGLMNIEDLKPKVVELRNLKTLKVMHCNHLVSTDGLEEYQSLEHLDLSNNQLEQYKADNLTEIVYLNLSCNSIRLAPNLGNYRELITLNLSHNRIEDLSPFTKLSDRVNSLKEINLNDNLIADLDQIAYLSKFKTLTKVHFRDKKRKTDNPICEYSKYEEVAKAYLPFLRELDGENVKEQENITTNELKQKGIRDYPLPPSSTKSHKSWITPKPGGKSEQVEYTPPFSLKPLNLDFTPVQVPLKLHEKDEMIQKLNYDLLSHKNQLQELENDKSEAVSQIASLQDHYSKITENLNQELEKKTDIIKEISDGKKELKFQLDLLEKKMTSVQSERDRYRELRDNKDDSIHDLNKEIIYLKTTKEEETDTKNMLQKELKYYKEKYDELTRGKSDLKDQNQQLEIKVSDLQKELIANNQEASKSWERLQAKYEQSLNQLEQYSGTIEKQNSKVTELKDITKMMDQEWKKKYDLSAKENQEILQKFQGQKQEELKKLEEAHSEAISALKKDFEKDVKMMDKSFTHQLKKEQERSTELKTILKDVSQKYQQSKDNLKKNKIEIDKKDLLIKELRDIINSSSKKLQKDREEIAKSRQEFESEKKKVMNEKIDLQNQIDTQDYKIKDLQKKYNLVQGFLNEKSEEYDASVIATAENKKKLVQCQKELELLKSTYNEEVETLNAELEKLAEENDELKQNCTTKDRMLDDKNIEIDQLKQNLKIKEAEIDQLQEGSEVERIKKEYEERLLEEVNNYQRLQQDYEARDKECQDLEEDNDQLYQKYQNLKQEKQKLEDNLNEKGEIIAQIQEDLPPLQNELRDKINQVNEKEENIFILERQMSEKEALIKTKNKQLKEFLDKWENSERNKAKEISALEKKLDTAIKENKVLITENERSKKELKEKFSQIMANMNIS